MKLKSLLIVSLLLIPTMAAAQVVQELNFKVSIAEAELLWKGLRKLPVEEVEVLMAKIRQQGTEQQKAVETPKPEHKDHTHK